MGYSKPKETTRSYLEQAPLPNHGKSYTVVTHKTVIDNTLALLKKSGFTIQREIYRASMNANVAQGIYHIYPSRTKNDMITKEHELGMMFAWTNSYDKSTRFQCAIGAYVRVCHNGMVAGDMMNWKRKHTGAANVEVSLHIADQIKNAEKYYARIIKDRDAMKACELTQKQQAELAGRLFIEEEVLDTQQMTMVKAELNKPSYYYGVDQDNCWAFYNHVTHALKKAHPKNWLQDSQNFHDFIVSDCLSNSSASSVETQQTVEKPAETVETKTVEPTFIEVDVVEEIPHEEVSLDTQLIENVFTEEL